MFPKRGASIAGNASWPSINNYHALGLAASLGTTTLQNVAPAGLYRLNVYMATNTAGTGGVSVTFSYTDSIGAKTLLTPAPLSFNAGEYSSDSHLIAVHTGDITFTTTYTTTGKYNLLIALEKLI